MPTVAMLELLELDAVTLVLVLTRVSGIFLFGPLLSARVLPVSVRASLVLAVSLLVSGLVPPPPAAAGNVVDLAIALVGELLVGLVLGTFLQMTFQALQLAGQASGTQIGLALANVINPQFDDQISTIAVIYVTLATFVFLGISGDRDMLAALLESFQTLPPGRLFFHESLLELALRLFQQSMIFAVRVAAPVTVALILVEIAMGFIGRSVPQLNILSVGFSIRVLVGLVVTLVSLHGVGAVFLDYLASAFDHGYAAMGNLLE